MSRLLRFAPPLALLAAAATLFCTDAVWCLPSDQTNAAGPAAPPVAWDTAFVDRSGGRPVHLVARYVDAHGQAHRLEEWRLGQLHLRRKTDDRIDLHADAKAHAAPGQPVDYTWLILDLQKRVAHRVSTTGMLHLGMLYSYYSMAHLLTRPPGTFTVTRTTQPAGAGQQSSQMRDLAGKFPCTWWQIDAAGQPSMRVCWLARYGVPLQTWSLSPQGWQPAFQVDSLDDRPIAATVFAANTAGFQVRDLDEIQAED